MEKARLHKSVSILNWIFLISLIFSLNGYTQNKGDEINKYLEKNNFIVNRSAKLTAEKTLAMNEAMDKFKDKKISFKKMNALIELKNKSILEKQSNLLEELKKINPPSKKLEKYHNLTIKYLEESIKSTKSDIEGNLKASMQHERKAMQYSNQAKKEFKKYGFTNFIKESFGN
ncbi:MAG: hypothetical protein K9L72_03390 [Candidatus Omnitrophica bacterium]|nr:hypothetical protein [Candidatus Omnitrophota bacterium]